MVTHDRSKIKSIAFIVSSLLIAWVLFVSDRYLDRATNPIVIINEDPGATVILDGKEWTFSKGIYTLHPEKESYVVEVRNRLGVRRRIIYPLDVGSDSGSVSVGKDEVSFHLKNAPLPQ